MNLSAASGRSINPKKQKQNTPQAAGELTQKRLKLLKQSNKVVQLTKILNTVPLDKLNDIETLIIAEIKK